MVSMLKWTRPFLKEPKYANKRIVQILSQFEDDLKAVLLTEGILNISCQVLQFIKYYYSFTISFHYNIIIKDIIILLL